MTDEGPVTANCKTCKEEIFANMPFGLGVEYECIVCERNRLRSQLTAANQRIEELEGDRFFLDFVQTNYAHITFRVERTGDRELTDIWTVDLGSVTDGTPHGRPLKFDGTTLRFAIADAARLSSPTPPKPRQQSEGGLG